MHCTTHRCVRCDSIRNKLVHLIAVCRQLEADVFCSAKPNTHLHCRVHLSDVGSSLPKSLTDASPTSQVCFVLISPGSSATVQAFRRARNCESDNMIGSGAIPSLNSSPLAAGIAHRRPPLQALCQRSTKGNEGIRRSIHGQRSSAHTISSRSTSSRRAPTTL